MDDISIPVVLTSILLVLTSVVIGLVLWWAIGRYRQSWLKKILAALGGVVLSYVVYLVFGTVLAIIVGSLHRPDLARETGAAFGHGFTTLPTVTMVVAIVILSFRGRFWMK